MDDLSARTSVTWRMSGSVRGPDGYTLEFDCDDSFRSWRQIVRWNLHYKHWGALRLNARDLFTKVIWRKLWRHS